MITILRGPRAALARFGVPSDLTLRWDVSAEAPAWGALRGMTAQLRAALGDAPVQAAFGGHDPKAPLVALSLPMRALETQLTPAQKRAREELAASKVALLPWAQPRTSPITRAWSEAFAPLFEGRCGLVILPEIDRADVSSLRSARTILRKASGTLSILVGHDTHAGNAGPFETWLRKLKVRELSMLEALPQAQVERVDMRSEPMIARRGGAYEEREPKTIETMRAAFDAYAFDASLSLALQLSPKLEGAELREAHALAAASALLLDPHAKGDDFGVGMVEAGFRGALEGETDPRKRACWAHHLAMLYGRARNDVQSALKYAEQAVKDAQTARALYVEAWARVARAQGKLLQRRTADATADLEAALARLDDPVALRETPRGMLEASRAIVANERARVAATLGQHDDLVHYRRMSDAHAAALAEDDRPGYDWLAPIDDERSPGTVRTFHLAELERAKKRLEPDDERAAARQLARAEMCLGDAKSARAHVARATRIAVLAKRPPNEVFTQQLDGVLAALRSGAFDDAENELSLIRADPRCEGDAAQAEALALLARAASGKGDHETAIERITTALAQAERSKERPAMARVRKVAADVHRVAGKNAEARALALKAREVLDDDLPPGDAIGVITALLACGVVEDALVAQAIELVPHALSDPETWWELAALLPFVKKAKGKKSAALDAAALAITIAAAGQRPDCAELVKQLRG
jgi:hypothetical protein